MTSFRIIEQNPALKANVTGSFCDEITWSASRNCVSPSNRMHLLPRLMKIDGYQERVNIRSDEQIVRTGRTTYACGDDVHLRVLR